MRPVLAAVFALTLYAAGPQVQAVAQTHYFELINRTHDSLVSLSVAASGSDAFEAKPLEAPLLGGGAATTIQIDGAGCRYDFRFGFRTGEALVYKDVDVCRNRSLRIRPGTRG